MTPNPVLSIVCPVYRAANIVDELVRRLLAAVEAVAPDFEIVLVEDGSPDDSWEKIVALTARDARVKGLRLSRNFGQHAAVTAGLHQAQGEFVAIIDCDLQDNPDDLPVMLAKGREGFPIVMTRRTRRQPWLRRAMTRIYYRIFNLLSDRLSVDDSIGGYVLLRREAVKAFLQVRDTHRHYMLIIAWLGFRRAVVDVSRGERFSGESSYSLLSLLRLAAHGIVSESTKLLKLAIGIGFIYVCAAVVGVVYLAVGYERHGYLLGWASTIVLILGSTGLILTVLGILGVYLGAVLEQARGRPLFVVEERRNIP